MIINPCGVNIMNDCCLRILYELLSGQFYLLLILIYLFFDKNPLQGMVFFLLSFIITTTIAQFVGESLVKITLLFIRKVEFIKVAKD